ncbi:MAG: diacylglycerol kinase family lipid kinase [Clostridiaceae bacterium]|nr:diacylglycerol kinase family lipid kinase [Clostridiaceae bacterium]
MEHLFIVNPVAGKGKALNIIPDIKDLVERHSLSYHMEITKAPKHATEIAREYIKSNRNLRIYAVGGDGTLNEVLQGVAGSDASLGNVPAGTGNDFLKSFCSKSDSRVILSNIIKARPVPVDLCKMNDMYFLNIASAGFDADVVANTQYLKRLPLIKGKVAYIGGILMSLIRLKNFQATFYIDDEIVHMPSVLLSAFANGKYYGGGMMPVPSALPDDGLLDICLIEGRTRLKILLFFPRFIKGAHTKMKGVSVKRCHSVRMVCTSPVHVNADGELFRLKEVNIEVIEKGVNFIKPDLS